MMRQTHIDFVLVPAAANARARRIERLGFRAHHHRDAGQSPLLPSSLRLDAG
jgi:hypothetical protein